MCMFSYYVLYVLLTLALGGYKESINQSNNQSINQFELKITIKNFNYYKTKSLTRYQSHTWQLVGYTDFGNRCSLR